MIRLSAALALGFSLLVAPAIAQDAAAPDGKALFRTKTCIACHGKDGAKAIQMYPDLAGQNEKYMLEQMNDIADGKRLSGPDARGYPRTQGMKDIMHLVNADERAAIAKYLAGQPAPKPRPLDPPISDERKAEGKDAFVKGGCVTCHGPDGGKPLPANPALAGMKRDYLVLQMAEIRDGVRKSPKLAAMMPFAKKLDEAKIAAIADYLSQVERPVR